MNKYDSVVMRSDDLVRVMEQMNVALPHQLSPFWHEPMNFFGMRVIEHEPRYVPKVQLSERVPLEPEFRMKYNLWLAEFFGYRDDSIIPKGTVLMWNSEYLRSFAPRMAVRMDNVGT